MTGNEQFAGLDQGIAESVRLHKSVHVGKVKRRCSSHGNPSACGGSRREGSSITELDLSAVKEAVSCALICPSVMAQGMRPGEPFLALQTGELVMAAKLPPLSGRVQLSSHNKRLV